MDKRNKALIILGALVLVFTIIGGTLAYFNWQSSSEQKTNVVFTVTSDFSCGADGGGSITSNDKQLAPAECTNETYAFQRPIVVKPTINTNGKTIYMDLYLQVNQIGTYLAQSQNFKYALTTDSQSCTNGLISNGTFQGTSANSKVYLFSDKTYSATTNDPYYLYIWLDKDEENNNTQNQPFDISLGGTCSNNRLPFNGTIYRYSAETTLPGYSIVPETKQLWCAIIVDVESEEVENTCDGGYYWNTEQECEDTLTEYNIENATCEQGTVTTGLTSYETNTSNLNKTYYLKHTVVDDIVTESYVEFVVTPTMAGTNNGMTTGTYALKGGDDGASFITNKTTLLNAFGSSNCTEHSTGFDCSVSDLYVYASMNGIVTAHNHTSASCNIYRDTGSKCDV